MKNKLLALGLCVLFNGASAFGAMMPSPYWSSVAQIEAIMHSEKVSSQTGEMIQSVLRLENLTFEIKAGSCYTVTLEAHIPDGPGPTTYTVDGEVEQTTCTHHHH